MPAYIGPMVQMWKQKELSILIPKKEEIEQPKQLSNTKSTNSIGTKKDESKEKMSEMISKMRTKTKTKTSSTSTPYTLTSTKTPTKISTNASKTSKEKGEIVSACISAVDKSYHETPLSTKCAGVIEAGPTCMDGYEAFVGQRKYALCNAWNLLEKGEANTFRDGIKKSWEHIHSVCPR